jgi:hypothetical protein
MRRRETVAQQRARQLGVRKLPAILRSLAHAQRSSAEPIFAQTLSSKFDRIANPEWFEPIYRIGLYSFPHRRAEVRFRNNGHPRERAPGRQIQGNSTRSHRNGRRALDRVESCLAAQSQNKTDVHQCCRDHRLAGVARSKRSNRPWRPRPAANMFSGNDIEIREGRRRSDRSLW